MLKIGVLASHTGTNFQAIADACLTGELKASTALLICNNSRAGVMDKAARAGVSAVHLSSSTNPDPAELDQAICQTLEDHDVELVVTAGYMKKLGPGVLHRFHNRIINIHPSLLPKYGGAGFYGARVHEAVLRAGEAMAGATVHLVNEDYDRGDILLQETLPVKSSDTAESLAARLRPIEHQLLIDAIKLFIDGRSADYEKS